jgi:16S rRNA (cytosine967-C5)-methyltransferase
MLLSHTADAVQSVRSGRSMTEGLAALPPSMRPGVQALTFHVLRWLGSAEVVRALLAPKAPPPAVDALLLTALALLWPAGAPGAAPEAALYAEHTLVDQAVAAARSRTPAAASFINAVLRRFLRERDAVVEQARRNPLGAYNHPPWWIKWVRQDWPEDWQTLLAFANSRAPMTLRVNARMGSGQDYVRLLGEAGRAATLLEDPGLQGQAVILHTPCAVQLLPGFAQGHVSVQDAAAQRAAPLLLRGAALQPGARVLDACAAPGGKTAHLLELAELDLLALDSDAQRLMRVRETLDRVGQRAEVRAGDARRPDEWWDGHPFDAILLDAPCTASGIVRRHPDVRWLRRQQDILALARVQSDLLDALWPLLKAGGRLLYATCSIFKAEGQHQIDAFLQRQPPGAALLEPQSPGHLMPTRDNANPGSAACGDVLQDGFFYALIRKT